MESGCTVLGVGNGGGGCVGAGEGRDGRALRLLWVNIMDKRLGPTGEEHSFFLPFSRAPPGQGLISPGPPALWPHDQLFTCFPESDIECGALVLIFFSVFFTDTPEECRRGCYLACFVKRESFSRWVLCDIWFNCFLPNSGSSSGPSPELPASCSWPPT